MYAPTLFSPYVCFSDIVYVGTIHSNHAELSKKMLEAGKHVLCEKPMAINWKQGKEVIDLARKKHLFFGEVSTFVLLSLASTYDTFPGVYYMFTHSLCFYLKEILSSKITMLRQFNETRHEKTCFCHMRTTKVQISLRIRAV